MELKSKSSQNRVPKQSLREDMSTERQAKNKKKQKARKQKQESKTKDPKPGIKPTGNREAPQNCKIILRVRSGPLSASKPYCA